MHHLSLLILMFALWAVGAQSADTTKRNSVRESVKVRTSAAPLLADLGAGLAIGGGTALPGFSLGIRARLNRQIPLYLGDETGAFFHVETPFAVLIPVYPTIAYVIDATPTVHPYAGLGIGIVIGAGSGYSDVDFGFAFKPGVSFTVARSADLFVEPRLGIFGGSFVFMPLVGAHLSI